MNTKIGLFSLHITEWPRMEQHFEAMAQKGWLITKLWGGFAVYKKIEPTDLTFAVAVYPEARAFERFDRTKSADYISQEEENGWRLAATKHNLQVFYRPKYAEGPDLRRNFQVGNIHSAIELETFSFIMLLVLNLFYVYQIIPPSPHMFYRNLSFAMILWMPLLIVFLAVRLLANAIFIYRKDKGLTLDNFHEYPAGVNRFLNASAYLIAEVITVSMLVTITIDYVESGRHFLVALLPLLAAMGVGLFLRKYFTGKKWDGIQKTMVVVVLVVTVVFATSYITRNRMMDTEQEELPQGQAALTVQDLSPDKTADYQTYRSSGSVLVPEYYRYYESLNGEISVNTEVVRTRSEKVAAYLFTLHQQEMDKFNYQFTSATDHFPEYDEVIYAIQPVFFIQDGPQDELREVSQRGTLLVREGLNVIRLSIDRDLNDPEIQALLANKINEIQVN